MTRPPPRSTLRRTVGRRLPSRRILLVCEGKRTEPEYLRGMKVRERLSAVKLHVVAGVTDPMRLVERAVQERDRLSRDDDFDDVWCIFDTESPIPHASLSGALALATTEGFRVARSNPCFELWIVLHFMDERSNITTKSACTKAGSCAATTGKGVRYESLQTGVRDAIRRADELENIHAQAGRLVPLDNPSSGMGRLAKELLAI